jgi:hypothetical protein
MIRLLCTLLFSSYLLNSVHAEEHGRILSEAIMAGFQTTSDVSDYVSI